MTNQPFPFAVRLIGFSEEESNAFDASFAARQGKGYAYMRLAEDNLQDPDLYVANAEKPKALIILADLRPTEVRPALLVGNPVSEVPYPRIDKPFRPPELFAALDRLVEKRADALSRLEASDVVAVPERRRSSRFDHDLTDPADYVKMRVPVPSDGIVLVVDRVPALRDYLIDLLARRQIRVEWASDEASTVELCKRQRAAVVMINTSMPDIDPYRLCSAIKGQGAPLRTVVIFLVSKPFEYDTERARSAGVDGFLNKPLASHHLFTVLKKFLPQFR